MFDMLDRAVELARELVARAELSSAAGEDAVRLFDGFSELENFAAAGRTLAARRIEETQAWYGSGYRKPSEWVAARSGVTLGSAIATLDTGRRLQELPATRDAFLSGELSAHQAQEIAAAAAEDPSAEASLLDLARKESVNTLRRECRQVIAAASRDADADERIHRSRSLRFWTDPDGAVRLDGRFTPDAGARLIAAVKARAKELLDQAIKAGSRERRDCYSADALVALADSFTPGPKAVVNVMVDYTAIERGYLEKGERCMIPGQGPITLGAAQRLAENGIIRAVLAEGADVRSIVTNSRYVPPKLKAALEARDPVCVVPGCDATDHLEIHHLLGFIITHRTRLEECAMVCHWHHLLLTHRRWRLEGSPGNWQFLPPVPRRLRE